MDDANLHISSDTTNRKGTKKEAGRKKVVPLSPCPHFQDVMVAVTVSRILAECRHSLSGGAGAVSSGVPCSWL